MKFLLRFAFEGFTVFFFNTRLNQTLINTTVLDLMIFNNITVHNSTTLPMEQLFNETARIPLDRMPFYYYFNGYFKVKVLKV